MATMTRVAAATKGNSSPTQDARSPHHQKTLSQSSIGSGNGESAFRSTTSLLRALSVDMEDEVRSDSCIEISFDKLPQRPRRSFDEPMLEVEDDDDEDESAADSDSDCASDDTPISKFRRDSTQGGSRDNLDGSSTNDVTLNKEPCSPKSPLSQQKVAIKSDSNDGLRVRALSPKQANKNNNTSNTSNTSISNGNVYSSSNNNNNSSVHGDAMSVASDYSSTSSYRGPRKAKIEQILHDAVQQREEHRKHSAAHGVLDLANNPSLRGTAIKSLISTDMTKSDATDQEVTNYTALKLTSRPQSPLIEDEKKESYTSVDEVAEMSAANKNSAIPEIQYMRSLSMTESDVNSLDGLPSTLHSSWNMSRTKRENMLQMLDGVSQRTISPTQGDAGSDGIVVGGNAAVATTTLVPKKHVTYLPMLPISTTVDPIKVTETKNSIFDNWPFDFLCGHHDPSKLDEDEEEHTGFRSGNWRHADDTFALLGCSMAMHRDHGQPMPTSLIRVNTEPTSPSYAESLRANAVDPRMQSWIENQGLPRDPPPSDGTYHLGNSRIVIVHEIMRGNWTWCTEWSPSGEYLAIATETHHLAIVDTTASTVWRVMHDQKIAGRVKNDTTHSIRSISWGSNFIAVGGTGNAVSIIEPHEPYSIIHTIKGTGFVGSLHWKADSNVLVIGSRLNKAMVYDVKQLDHHHGQEKLIECELMKTIECKNWVNRVAFSPGGTCLAVGDAKGIISVYSYDDNNTKPFEVSLIKSFMLEDAVLDVEWSPDGKWLYVGGEDFDVSVIDTNHWELVHKIRRDRWIQCISSSRSGTHIAVGGVSSEISILDVEYGWDSVMGIQLKGLVPLSAKWHPKDQYLALTGQNNSILAVETTNARHVKGHHLHSISPVISLDFSPDGRMCIVGNEAGLVTFYALSGSTFETAYELVVTLNDRLSTFWSLNGAFAAIASRESLLIVKKSKKLTKKERKGKKTPPNASGFSVQKIMRDLGEINAVCVDKMSHYVAVSGTSTRILDAILDFAVVREWKCKEPCFANAWSPDGRWLATIGQEKLLTIYDTGGERIDRWRPIFSLKCDYVGRSLAWGPVIVGGLMYLAYGGDGNEITILEIRTFESTWEIVLRIPRDGTINGLDWNTDGLLAAAIGNGTVSIVDLAYLQSGVAVNEMNYNWQRQALTCFTEIRRNRGKNSMRTVKWIPSAPGSDSLLAVGGTDGEVEIVDLTERRRCRGYS